MLKRFASLAAGAAGLALMTVGSLVGLTGAANATACSGNITTGTVCTDAAGVTFDFTDLVFTGTTTAGDSLSVSNPSGNLLVFTIAYDVLPTDIFLQYSATGSNLTGVSALFGSVGSTESLDETVCTSTVALTTGVSACPSGDTQLALLNATNGGQLYSASFASQSEILISKDVEDSSGFSDFQDSVVQNVPEPITISLFGAGLAGLGFTARRRKAAPKA